MKTKISSLMAFVVLSAASLMILFAAPNAQPSGNLQTEPEVSVPSMVSTSSDNGGMRTLADTVLPTMRYGSHINLSQPSVTLDRLDIRSFTLDANQIGVNRSVAISPDTRAQKFVNPDGSRIIVLIIKSSGASGIGVHFRDFELADGEEVYVYGTTRDSIVFGPYTNKGPWDDGEFWTGTVDGDTLIVEFYTRTDKKGQGFEIFEVSHIFSELDWRFRSDQPDVLNCERDASCNPVIQNNAVARIVYNDNGAHYCTGTLLNDLAQDHCPYFLTANHCVRNQTVAQTVQLYWFYQTTSCNSGTLRSGAYSPPGTDLLATSSPNDFSLLRLLHNVPAGVVYSGWTSAAQSTPTPVFGLHHPGIYYPPYIQSYLRRSSGSITSTNINCQSSGLINGYRVDWASGTTEAGSSGSGLFRWNGHQLVGVASCAIVTCNSPYTSYSKLFNFFPQIRAYIYSLTPPPPKANPATLVTSNSFRANWRSVCGATGYRLDVSTSSSFNSYVAGYQNLNVGNVLSRSVTGLNAGTTYYYRVRAYNGNGTSGNSNVVHVTTTSSTCNIAGTWTGTVTGTYNASGCSWTGTTQFSMVVTQNGTTISGPAHYDGIPCFNLFTCGINDFPGSTGSVSGTANCPTVSVSYSGTANNGVCAGYAVSETFNLTLNGNTLSGTGGGNHTISLTR
jgi:Fibronectin type III domain/Trypsin-like peptidase domain